MNNNTVESATTTAGLLGFITLFALAIACWLLFRSMNGRLRRIRFRAEQEAAERAAEREAAASGTQKTPPV